MNYVAPVLVIIFEATLGQGCLPAERKNANQYFKKRINRVQSIIV